VIGQRAATLIGGTAVLMWSGLALLTAASGDVPPFQLLAMSFLIASLLGGAKWLFRGERGTVYFRQPLPVWLLGVGGLFGYHFFYFVALRNAPAVEASLIAYLWPLLIVLFSALLPGERLRWWHIAGGLLGFAGCALIATGGGAVVFQVEYALGYAAAFACCLTWSGYSVLSRRFKSVPTDTVAWFCIVTAILGLVCHLIFETTVWPRDAVEWLAVLMLGLGPVGAAFFVWDYGVKHGDIRALGVFSYSAPLISTLLLILFGRADATWVVGVACIAIVGGALLASRDILSRSVRKATEA
jgi:drug/metabolite transporter (DMT)-like permease